MKRPRRSAILVTRDDRGRVLLVRQRGGPFAGAWLLPGGGLEPGESFDDALRREVREETGLEVVSATPLVRYDVRCGAFWGDVLLYRGVVSGTALTAANDDEPVEWRDVTADGAHAVLLRELADAGVIAVPAAQLEGRAAQSGIVMASSWVTGSAGT